MENFEIEAELREDAGKGASRRLRRSGKVPGIVYGAGKDPASLTLNHNDLMRHLENEAFYSHVLSLKLNGNSERVVLKDLQRHPGKPLLLHADFQRVDTMNKLTMRIPLHFINEDICPGKKISGGIIAHHLTEVEVSCLAKDLPEYIDVDVINLEMGDAIHLDEVTLPEGVTLTTTNLEQTVVSITAATEEKPTEVGEAAEGAEGVEEPTTE